MAPLAIDAGGAMLVRTANAYSIIKTAFIIAEDDKGYSVLSQSVV